MTIIGLIRHGVTDWNQQGRMQGQKDIPLNDDGRRQAALLGKRLAAEQWDYIYSSSMLRAKETAEIVAKAMGKKLSGADERIRERTFGRVDGTTEAERVEQWGTEWRTLEHGGESEDAVFGRSLDFIKEIEERHKGQRVLVITHGAVIWIILRNLFPNLPDEPLHNTCVNVLHKAEEQWEYHLLNCTKHLDEEERG